MKCAGGEGTLTLAAVPQNGQWVLELRRGEREPVLLGSKGTVLPASPLENPFLTT